MTLSECANPRLGGGHLGHSSEGGETRRNQGADGDGHQRFSRQGSMDDGGESGGF